jgi:hypothetical protein
MKFFQSLVSQIVVGGLEKLDRGIVYHDKKIVTGKVFKLYKMNKEIRSDLATINIALLELKKILEDFLSQTKVLYFKYISNLKYNPATEKVQKFSSKKNHTVETLEDATKLNYVLNVNEWRYINFSQSKTMYGSFISSNRRVRKKSLQYDKCF